MCRERQQRWIEADRVALAFEHCTFKVVVQDAPWDAGPCREGTGVTGQEAVHTRIEEEAQIDHLPRPRQNHHKGHQGPARQSDLQVAKASPVALTLFSWQGAKPNVRLGHRARTMKRNQVSEVVMTAAVAPLINHRIQALAVSEGNFFSVSWMNGR